MIECRRARQNDSPRFAGLGVRTMIPASAAGATSGASPGGKNIPAAAAVGRAAAAILPAVAVVGRLAADAEHDPCRVSCSQQTQHRASSMTWASSPAMKFDSRRAGQLQLVVQRAGQLDELGQVGGPRQSHTLRTTTQPGSRLTAVSLGSGCSQMRSRARRTASVKRCRASS